jgi:uncharacterized damage-inducible protein DinB
MSEIQRIIDQMDRAFSGDAWHGPPLKSLLDGLSAEDASEHPIERAHSIWELVRHIATWNTIVAKELSGASVEVTPELDWSAAADSSEIEWQRAVQNLSEAHDRLRKATEALRDDELDVRPAKRTNNTCYLMLHGVVQHDLYHAGQIAILKKALQSRSVR